MKEFSLEKLGDLIRASGMTLALTGAGISSESGIPTFRGVQGLWERYDLMEYAHISAFRRDPIKVWSMLLELDASIHGARPNPAHRALAELEAMGRLDLVVTQNVDNLHQAAGNREVVEFHGNAHRFRCLDCGSPLKRNQVDFQTLPPRCTCGGLVKPDVIFFGEAIPWSAHRKAFEAAIRADLVLVIGTSATVAPASEIPLAAKQSGAAVVEINLEKTMLTGTVADLTILGPASEILPLVVQRLKKAGPERSS